MSYSFQEFQQADSYLTFTLSIHSFTFLSIFWLWPTSTFLSLLLFNNNNAEWFYTPRSRSSNTHCSLVACAAAANVNALTNSVRVRDVLGFLTPAFCDGANTYTCLCMHRPVSGHLCWSSTDGKTTASNGQRIPPQSHHWKYIHHCSELWQACQCPDVIV